ncbi:MAG: M67 family metallopeptidase [Sphingobium sp.]
MAPAIARSVLADIQALADGQATEICGLLLGGQGRVDTFLASANVAADPARRFEIDPAVLIAAHRAARHGGPAIVGCYHSHPSGRAVPSAADAAQAAPEGMLWLIVGSGQARLWRAGPGDGGATVFHEEPIVVA